MTAITYIGIDSCNYIVYEVKVKVLATVAKSKPLATWEFLLVFGYVANR